MHERRRIWFWQQARFLRDGWWIQRTAFRGSSLCFWGEALASSLRPIASRSPNWREENAVWQKWVSGGAAKLAHPYVVGERGQDETFLFGGRRR